MALVVAVAQVEAVRECTAITVAAQQEQPILVVVVVEHLVVLVVLELSLLDI